MPYLKNYKGDSSWKSNKKKYFLGRKSSPRLRESGFGHSANGMSYNKFSWWKKNKKKVLIAGGGLAVFFLLFIVGAFIWLSRGLPDPNKLNERELALSTKIYDRTGETVLYEISGEQKRTFVNLNEIPDYVKWATIAVEDKDFYKHGGFSLWAIVRTAITNVIYGRSAGGSTMTQQFVKNAVFTNEKLYTRKIKELILSYQLEKKFSKDEILQMYLNEIPYGSTAYGIEAASQKYFAKGVKEINLAEAAILAALPQAPSRYSPYGPNQDILFGRQKYILDLMVEQQYISKEQAEEAKGYNITFKQPTENIIAPHFVMYVKEILSDKFGEKMVEQGGLKIITTLDLYKQKIAEETITEIAPDNEKKFNATNAALVSIDPKTGQILTMVGSRDYFDEEIDGQVNIATSKRQPGSSLKPLVYGAAFMKGYTPNTILYDVVTNFSNDASKTYEPHNYDSKEHGPITMRKALGGSLNIPAVKTLYLAGVNNVLDMAQELGYTTFADRERFGLSLVLGGGEVKLLEHVNAYSAFAREGIIHPTAAILKIEGRNGEVLEEFKSEEKKALDPKIARLVNDVLTDNSARSWVFGEKNYLTLGNRPVGAKTGTTNDYHDAWTIGYTPSLVTGVWVGNADNKEMKKGADGSVLAAPIWNKYMKKILGDTPIENFKKAEIPKTGKPILDGEVSPENKIKIDRASGKLATEFTPASFIEEKSFFKPHDILYYVNKDDPLGPAPENPAADPQFNLWESRVLKWAEKNGYATSTEALPPTENDDVHTPENQPRFDIITPENNDTLTDALLNVRIEASAPRGVNRAEYYINDNLLDTVTSYPFNLEKRIDFLANGFYNLKVRVCDDIDNCASKNLEVNIVLPQNNVNKEVNFNVVSPMNGLAVNNIDFPLNIEIYVDNPGQVARANFFYTAATSSESVAIATLNNLTGNSVIAPWTEIPASGTYKINIEIVTWDKKTKKSPPITITVTKSN